ncbi:MAG: putative endolysin [Prokaryotic dsDNA virus sp.]|nr:MAG: putative endolysin [Prokaryotic dsDNA virus sp.]|tara:strand:- start:1269 stop:1814 length:546 start_codon:yes stop_codon:yes gene_type:complete
MTRINQATVDLVKEFEGLELSAYRDPVGVLTIGYGYTNQAGYGPGVQPGDRWTQEQAEKMLAEGLDRFGAQIRPMFTRTPNENQFGAFVSLAYNIGVTAFRNSTALRRFNAGDNAGAAEALTWFNKAGGTKLRGLVRRREEEKALFLTPPPIRHADPAEVPQGWLAALVKALARLFKWNSA